MLSENRIDAATGVLLWLVTGIVTMDAWRLHTAVPLLPALMVTLTVLLALRVRRTRLMFVATAILLSVLLVLFVPDWKAVLVKGVRSAAFIAAFFTALSTLRNVAQTSPAISAGGTFLALQPPGRRYAALTLGGVMFSLMLNYGAISLLGSLATASAGAEADAEIRRHRTRRMLLAIQRGFIASLPWSPLAFAMAITNALIPGARWADSVWPGMVTAAIIAGSGWALDSLFKPKLSGPLPPASPVEGSWRSLSPLLLLLVLLGGLVGILHEVTGINVPGIVMLVVPILSLGWAWIQQAGGAVDTAFGARLRHYATVELPRSRGEITLLIMAGYIGTVGAPLLLPAVEAAGLDPTGLPTWLILGAFVWLIPLLGQIGMNPILAVTLIAPLIPEATELGVTPAAVVTAIVAGWAISGISSPFTATTMLVGSFAHVSAVHVGVRWNGLYVLVTAVLLTVWVLAYALLIG
jgi:hypothetical protein